jgi:pSer/pThr/pTyr-binding forkhead associated (FHA) protein
VKLIVLKNHVPLHEVSVETTDPTEVYEIFVGRAEDCHVLIDDPLISRHHFVLKSENLKWYCEKLTQLGVITLNGSLISKNEIKNGDEIKCGPYSVIVTELLALEAAPVSPLDDPALDTPELIPEPADEPATEIMAPPTAVVEEPIIESEPEPELVSELSDGPAEENDFASSDLDSFSDDVSEGESDNAFGEETESLDDEINSDFGDGFGDATEGMSDEFGLATTDSDQNESTRFFKAFVNYQLVLFGEHAPYDRFQIDHDEIFIGRDANKCQIILNDPEVSSVHAVIRKTNVEVTLEDLNSSNGTILNGERINKATITAGDEFVIGGTSFTSDLLESESERLMPVELDQVVETEEVIEEEIIGDDEINFDSMEGPPEKSIIKRIWKDPVKRKKAIYIGAGLALAWLFLMPDPEPEQTAKAPTEKEAPAKVEEEKPQIQLSQELENARNVAYELGVGYFEQTRYDLAQIEFQKVVSIDPTYKNVQTYLEQTNVGLKRLQELEAQKRADEERIKTKKIIDELLVKAREAVKERQVQLAESYFSQIVEKDPENIEVAQLKLEIEAWQKEEERKAMELAAKEASRKKMVDSLTPGKTFYIKKEWYRAILKLEEFLRQKQMDEDLVKEASEMLSDAKNQLASELGPLLGKARSLKEGQDFKAAYEAYLEILKVEPTNAEALNEVDDIRSQLENRSKKIYREAIIAESLSLFGDAKEKFLEVQQISPTDSDYYKKATDKLKNYLE